MQLTPLINSNLLMKFGMTTVIMIFSLLYNFLWYLAHFLGSHAPRSRPSDFEIDFDSVDQQGVMDDDHVAASTELSESVLINDGDLERSNETGSTPMSDETGASGSEEATSMPPEDLEVTPMPPLIEPVNLGGTLGVATNYTALFIALSLVPAIVLGWHA